MMVCVLVFGVFSIDELGLLGSWVSWMLWGWMRLFFIWVIDFRNVIMNVFVGWL